MLVSERDLSTQKNFVSNYSHLLVLAFEIVVALVARYWQPHCSLGVQPHLLVVGIVFVVEWLWHYKIVPLLGRVQNLVPVFAIVGHRWHWLTCVDSISSHAIVVPIVSKHPIEPCIWNKRRNRRGTTQRKWDTSRNFKIIEREGTHCCSSSVRADLLLEVDVNNCCAIFSRIPTLRCFETTSVHTKPVR